MNAAMLLFVASTVAPPAPPAAVAPVAMMRPAVEFNFATTAPVAPASFRVGEKVTFVEHNVASALTSLKPVVAQAPQHQLAGKSMTFFIQVGIVFGGGHVGVGGGIEVAFIPMQEHEQFEVNADVNIGVIASHFGVTFSFNGQYNFHLSNNSLVPFAGAGIGVVVGSGNTTAGFNLFFGGQLEMASGKVLRFQVRFLINGGTATTLMIGFAF